MSRYMHYNFCRGRKVKHSDESVLPVTKKEGKCKGKRTIGPQMKNGDANLCLLYQLQNNYDSYKWEYKYYMKITPDALLFE